LLLATATIPVALIFAWLGLQATLRIVPTEAIPDEAVITLNVPVLLVSIAIALLTVLIFGLAPAWRSANPQLGTSLGRGAHSSGGRSERRLLGSFVVFEIALSLTLLTLANLMVRSLIAAENTPVAFSPDRTLALQLPFRQDRYPTPQSRSAFLLQLLEHIRHIPGVKSATTDSSFPLMGALGVNIQIARQPADNRPTNLHLVDPQYLAVSRLKLLQGHFIDERETGERAYDAVVTQRFVQRYFKNENVLGKVVHLRVLGGEEQKPLLEGDFTVVGVIEDAPVMTDVSFQGYSPADIFLPNTVAPLANILLVSTEFPAGALMNPVRRAVYSVDKDQPIAEMLTVRELLDSHSYAGPRFSLGPGARPPRRVTASTASATMSLNFVALDDMPALGHVAKQLLWLQG
jgi:putative ABC transport system permease protein